MAPRSSSRSEDVTRVRLSRWFFMRDFLYSDISNLHGIANLPADPDLGIAAGRRLCEEFLGPPRCARGIGAIACSTRSERSTALSGLADTSPDPGMPNHTGDHGDQYQGLLTR